jgi:formate hydrogenlyase transcriptional activator
LSDVSAEELVAFERMLADLSARFANVPGELVEIEIRTAQTMLRQFLGFDRCSYLEFQEDGLLTVVSSSAVDSVEPIPLGPFTPQLPWYFFRLSAGETIAFQALADALPPEATAEAEYWRKWIYVHI